MNTCSKWFAILCTFAVLASAGAQASVTISGTRVVYPLDQREVTVKLNNDSASPSLVQAWMDEGDANQKAADSKAPFVITPPIFRMNANKAQTLRVMYSGEALPQDRESLYWLNVLDVPPKAQVDPGVNTLQLAYRTRIKVFVRPPHLPGDPGEAPRQLQWKVAPAQQGDAQVLAVTNPTPYYVSFSEVSVSADGHTYRNEQGGMIAPRGQGLLAVPKMSGVRTGKIHYMAISDYGGAIEGDADITP